MKEIFGRRLKEARKMSGLSLRELSNKIDNYVKFQMIDKYEKGNAMPGSDVLIKLADALDVSIDYFFKEYNYKIEFVEYRKSSRFNSNKLKDSLSEVIISEYERYYEIEQILNISEKFVYPFEKPLIKNFEDIEKYADKLRSVWELGADAIPSLIEIIENNNIKVFEIDCKFNKNTFDGLSGFINNNPIIAINSTIDTVRKRFTLLHELGHILFDFDPLISDKEIERLCHAFAGALLFPQKAVLKYFPFKRKKVSITELIEIKEVFGISVQALIKRLELLNVINSLQSTSLFIYLSRNKLKDEKKLGFYPTIEKCYKLKRYVLSAVTEEIISLSKGAELLKLDLISFREQLGLI
ncbi:MAG TPA: XRE family transcriptional regulator [Melioribacteraceae bacterium]|nr:XRE family transcriptional regulator [Melioribacteraceae bacterium]